MRKIRIFLEDLMIVLEAMQSNGTEEVIIFQHEETGNPAICDAENDSEIISFTTVSEDEPGFDESIH